MWIKPEYPRKKIGRAGEVLIGKENQSFTIDHALAIVSNWRSSHAYPLNSIQNSLRYRAKKIDEEYLVAQRLKRLSSIKNKLNRFPEMKLHRMQDIGGCRAILSSNELVYKLRDDIIGIQNFNIRKEDDYIATPKDTGYRGIHLISEYCGKEEFNGLRIEIQLRSRLQHYWATGVEIIGTFTNQQLKAGIGGNDWLLFFQLMSLLIANIENNELINLDYAKKIKQLDEELKIKEKLAGYSVITNHTEQLGNSKGRFLVTLNVDERRLRFEYFTIWLCVVQRIKIST
jgi:putative GTP pyrophosphokinase